MTPPDGRLTDELDPEDRPPRDACGVFGVWAPDEDVAKLAYYGLYALQHRGQESAGRVLVAVRPGADEAFARLRDAHGVPGHALGTVGGGSLAVDGWFDIPLAELAAVHTRTLPALFG